MWYVFIVLAFESLRYKDCCKFEDSLVYIKKIFFLKRGGSGNRVLERFFSSLYLRELNLVFNIVIIKNCNLSFKEL